MFFLTFKAKKALFYKYLKHNILQPNQIKIQGSENYSKKSKEKTITMGSICFLKIYPNFALV